MFFWPNRRRTFLCQKYRITDVLSTEDAMDYLHTAEIVLNVIFVLVGALLIVFGNKTPMLLGGVILIGTVTYFTAMDELNKENGKFMVKQFNAQKTIQCSLWRGESILIDPNKGWRLIDDRLFVKDDRSIRLSDSCMVVGEAFPHKSSTKEWFAFISAMGVLFWLRKVRKQRCHQ